MNNKKSMTNQEIDPGLRKILEIREKESQEVEKLKGEEFNPLKPFFDYCVIDNKYTAELHEFHCQDSKDFWGNTWTVRTCQKNGCGFKSEGYSQYVPGSIPDDVNIKLNAWDMLKIKQLLDSIVNNEKEVSLIRQMLNDNKDCRENF